MIKLTKRIKQLMRDMLVPVGLAGGYTTVGEIADMAAASGNYLPLAGGTMDADAEVSNSVGDFVQKFGTNYWEVTTDSGGYTTPYFYIDTSGGYLGHSTAAIICGPSTAGPGATKYVWANEEGVALGGLISYVDHTDADNNMLLKPSGTLYKLAGDRTIYAKP
jgi:hypothetical protein